jgi:hypothetical protein
MLIIFPFWAQCLEAQDIVPELPYKGRLERCYWYEPYSVRVKKNVKQTRYMPGVAQSVPGS